MWWLSLWSTRWVRRSSSPSLSRSAMPHWFGCATMAGPSMSMRTKLQLVAILLVATCRLLYPVKFSKLIKQKEHIELTPFVDMQFLQRNASLVTLSRRKSWSIPPVRRRTQALNRTSSSATATIPCPRKTFRNSVVLTSLRLRWSLTTSWRPLSWLPRTNYRDFRLRLFSQRNATFSATKAKNMRAVWRMLACPRPLFASSEQVRN